MKHKPKSHSGKIFVKRKTITITLIFISKESFLFYRLFSSTERGEMKVWW